MKARLVLLLGLVALVLNGCGFHLRGGGQKLSDLPPVAIVGGERNGARLHMERILGGPGGPLVADIKDAEVGIEISEDLFEERVLTVSTAARVTEYELAYILKFRLVDADGEELRAPERIVLTDDYTFDAAVVLAKDRERDVIGEVLAQRMAQRVLRTIYQGNLRKPR